MAFLTGVPAFVALGAGVGATAGVTTYCRPRVLSRLWWAITGIGFTATTLLGLAFNG